MQLIDEAKQFYKLYSVWFFAFIAVIPDLFNLAIAHGILTGEDAPAQLSYTIKLIAFLGAAARLVKQTALAKQAAAEAEDKAAE